MTIRDLTPRQRYNLNRKFKKHLRVCKKLPAYYLKDPETAFMHAFNFGAKEVLALIPGDGVYGPKYKHADQCRS